MVHAKKRQKQKQQGVVPSILLSHTTNKYMATFKGYEPNKYLVVKRQCVIRDKINETIVSIVRDTLQLKSNQYGDDDRYEPGYLVTIIEPNQSKAKRNYMYKTYFIDKKEYMCPRFHVSPFNEEHATRNKIQSNFLFSQLLLTYTRVNRHIVYLDDPVLGLTTTCLQSNGTYQLHVPNPQFLDSSLIPFMSQFLKPNNTCNNIHTYGCTIFEWLRDTPITNDTYYDVGMDYCCTWQGNDSCNPQHDIVLLFQSGLLARHHGVVWITVNTRGQTRQDMVSTIVSFITKEANKNHYTIQYLHAFTCMYKHMITLFFVTLC